AYPTQTLKKKDIRQKVKPTNPTPPKKIPQTHFFEKKNPPHQKPKTNKTDTPGAKITIQPGCKNQ
ncbi:hypothetical protein ACQWF3_25625, partial [Salmonella enterica subsp. enterica serovar Infantis]